jgi:type I restriction enzyme, S subunit
MAKNYKLGEICEIRSGKTPSTKIKEYWCSHKEKCDCISWYTGKDITQQAAFSEKKITHLALEKYKIKTTTDNSILYSKVRYIQPFYLGIGGLACNEGVCIIEPNLNFITPNYLHYLLKSKQEELYLQRTGSVFPSISQKELEFLKISLPSLPEQAQILQKFQIVYNKIFQSEIVYNNNLLEIIKTILEYADLLFLKYKNTQIKIKDHFQLIAGKTPYASLYKNNKELYELVKKKSRQPGTIK